MHYTRLTVFERDRIFALKEQGYSQKETASIVSRSPATISRELTRNCTNGTYSSNKAQIMANQRKASIPKKKKIIGELFQKMKTLLSRKLSPEQTSQQLAKESLFINKSSIYDFIEKDRLQKGTLFQHLRLVPAKLRRAKSPNFYKSGTITGSVSIEERPAIVLEKSRIGDFEADLIS